LRRISGRAHGADSNWSSFRLFAFAAIPLFVVYALTADYSLPYNIDAATNMFTAWELGTEGDIHLDDFSVLATDEYIGNIAWVVPAKDSYASQYPPGAALLAAPLYAVWPVDAKEITAYGTRSNAPPVEIPLPPLVPAGVTAAAVTAVAMGLLAMAMRRLSDARTALLAAYVLGLATGAWSVAANALWQHGPGMLWIAAGGLLSIDHQLSSGFAYGAAVLTRPHTALVAAGNGLWQSWQQRRSRPAVLIGLGSAVGLAALVWYNAAVFGSASISGGYGATFGNRAASLDLVDYLGNIILALVHPRRGLFVFSPFLVLLIPGIRAAWRAAPGWVRGSAIGGLLYLLLQLKANRYSGGEFFWGYRYPLETLAAAAPLLLLSYTEWLRTRSRLVRRAFWWLVTASVALTAIGALAY
jgi:hypothetical protein